MMQANEPGERSKEKDGESKRNAKVADSFTEADAILSSHLAHPDRPKLAWFEDQFYRWNGRCWLILPESELAASVGTFLDQRFCKITKSTTTNVVEALKSRVLISSGRQMPCWIDRRDSGPVLAVKNGLVDIDVAVTGNKESLLRHTPMWFSPAALDYEFDAAAECPTWKRVLSENLEGDPERILILQQFFGYCLVPGLEHHRFIVLEGEGSNGKSVVLAALVAMLGQANVSSIPLHRLSDRFSPASTLGKLANVSAETDETTKAIEHRLKELTSGDSCAFERKFKQPVSAVPTAKLIFACNERPQFRDRSAGLWRRMILIPFRRQVPPEDVIRGMDTTRWWEESGELPGILNWAIEGLDLLRERGQFATSQVCIEAMKVYQSECNPIRDWLKDNFRASPGSELQKSDVYQSHTNWAKDNGHNELTPSQLAKEIQRVFEGVTPKRIRQGNSRVQVFSGICRGSDS